MKRETVDVHVYLPPGLLKAIRKLAKQNHRSTTGEIVAAIADYVSRNGKSKEKR